MRKRLFLIFTIIIMAVLVAGLAVGCKNAKEGEAERIGVADTHIFLAPYGDAESPYGDPSTYKIETSVYPLETADQRVNFSLKESADREYLSVAPDGTIKAKGEVKADEEGNPLDITVIAQKPKLAPYIPSMIRKTAEAFSASPDDINIKATTEEKLGFTGRMEGIACHCVVLLRRRSGQAD